MQLGVGRLLAYVLCVGFRAVALVLVEAPLSGAGLRLVVGHELVAASLGVSRGWTG